MRKFLLAIIFSGLFIAATAQTATYTTHIDILKGEQWWGVFVNGSPGEPFKTPFKVNTATYDAACLMTPFLVSSAGRYIWSDSPMEIEFTGEQFTITSNKEEIKAESGGRTLRAAYMLCCLKNILGGDQNKALRTPAPEFFTLPLYDTHTEMAGTPDATSLIDYAGQITQHGFPAGILLISDGWQAPDGSIEFDPVYFPDPKAMVDNLHAQGFKVMLTVVPYAPAAGRNYRTARGGDFLCETNGRPMVIQDRSGYHLCYDLGNTDVATRFKTAIDRLKTEYGIDGFLFDCSAVIGRLKEDRLAAFMEGWIRLGDRIALCEYAPGLNQAFTPYINCLTTDHPFDWEFLATRQADILSAGLVGYPFCRMTPQAEAERATDPQLMLRSLQQAAAMPVMHVSFAPWRIAKGETELEPYREAIKLRQLFGPYIEELAGDALKSGEPMLRHMDYQFPRNGFSDCTDQFMLGSRYLIAPVLDSTEKRIVRFPKGVWYSPDGQRYKGPVVKEVSAPLGQLLYFEQQTKNNR